MVPRGWAALAPPGRRHHRAGHRCRCAIATAVMQAPPMTRASRPTRADLSRLRPVVSSASRAPPARKTRRRDRWRHRALTARWTPRSWRGRHRPHVTSASAPTTQIAVKVDTPAMPDGGASSLDRCRVGFGPRERGSCATPAGGPHGAAHLVDEVRSIDADMLRGERTRWRQRSRDRIRPAGGQGGEKRGGRRVDQQTVAP